MPAGFKSRRDAEAFPLAKLAAGGKPRGHDGFLSDRGWTIGTATEQAAIVADVDIDSGAGWVFAVADSQGERITAVQSSDEWFSRTGGQNAMELK